MADRRWLPAACALAPVALAAPGDLDPSFGDGGTSRFDVRSDPNPGNPGGFAAAQCGRRERVHDARALAWLGCR